MDVGEQSGTNDERLCTALEGIAHANAALSEPGGAASVLRRSAALMELAPRRDIERLLEMVRALDEAERLFFATSWSLPTANAEDLWQT